MVPKPSSLARIWALADEHDPDPAEQDKSQDEGLEEKGQEQTVKKASLINRGYIHKLRFEKNEQKWSSEEERQRHIFLSDTGLGYYSTSTTQQLADTKHSSKKSEVFHKWEFASLRSASTQRAVRMRRWWKKAAVTVSNLQHLGRVSPAVQPA